MLCSHTKQSPDGTVYWSCSRPAKVDGKCRIHHPHYINARHEAHLERENTYNKGLLNKWAKERRAAEMYDLLVKFNSGSMTAYDICCWELNKNALIESVKTEVKNNG